MNFDNRSAVGEITYQRTGTFPVRVSAPPHSLKVDSWLKNTNDPPWPCKSELGDCACRRDETALVDGVRSRWPRAMRVVISTTTTSDSAATTPSSSFSRPLRRAQQPRPMSPPRPAAWNAMTGLYTTPGELASPVELLSSLSSNSVRRYFCPVDICHKSHGTYSHSTLCHSLHTRYTSSTVPRLLLFHKTGIFNAQYYAKSSSNIFPEYSSRQKTCSSKVEIMNYKSNTIIFGLKILGLQGINVLT